MQFPDDCKYTKEHEWVKVQGTSATVGITDFAQKELGELVFVELPQIGKECKQGGSICVVESTKAASDVYSPISGVVKEINVTLADSPTLVNTDPYKSGWLCKLDGINAGELTNLMSAKQYAEYLGGK